MKKIGLLVMAGFIVFFLAVSHNDRGSAVPAVNWQNDYRPGMENETAYMDSALVNGQAVSEAYSPNSTAANGAAAVALSATAGNPDQKNTASFPAADKKPSPPVEKKTARPTAVAAAPKAIPAPEPSRGSRASSAGVLDTARKYLGVPYVYGGESPKGFDCSGFTQYVFDKYGVNLPRTAESQASVGQKISRSDLAAGDLVFFNTEHSGSINHVGIYAGGNRFIHASRTKGITITSMDDSYYKNKLVTSRRVIR